MKSSSRSLARIVLSVGSLLLASVPLDAQTVLIAGGGNYINGAGFYLGTHSGSPSGLVLSYDDVAADVVKLHSNRVGSWLWENYDGTTTWPSMRLDQANSLILYNGTAEGVKLNPVTGSLKLGSHASGTLTADANGVITTGGAFIATGAFTASAGFVNSSGSFTSPTGLSLSAGGTNQNIVLTPSGTGNVILIPAGGTGNVGIKTSTPEKSLHVAFNSATVPSVKIGSGTDAQGWYTFLGNDLSGQTTGYIGNAFNSNTAAFQIRVKGTSSANARLTVMGSGNVGIGTTAPSARLHVYGGSVFNQTATGLAYHFGGNADGATNAKYSAIGMGSGGHITFNSATDALAPTEYARFTAAGNLGIGTTSPAYKVDVNGSTRIQNVLFSKDGSNNFTIVSQTTAASIGLDAVGGIGNVLQNNQPFSILGGNVGVGTATPQVPLQVGAAGLAWNGASGQAGRIWGANSPASGTGLVSVLSTDAQGADKGGSLSFGGNYSAANSVDFGSIAGRKENGTSGDTAGYLQFATRTNGLNLAEAMRITSSGNVGIRTTSPYTVLHVSSANNALGAGSPSGLLTGEDNKERIGIWSAGTSGGTAVYLAAGARGTTLVPTATQSGDALGYFQLGGYDGTNWTRASWITGTAEETWDGSGRGSNLAFFTTPIDSTTIAERMRITSAGNVGIGTATPAVKLDVVGSANVSGNLTVAGTFSSANLGATTLTGGATGLSLASGGTSQNITLTPSGTGSTILNGNVGVGTASPQSSLHVNGGGVRIDVGGGVALQNQDGLGNLLWSIKRGTPVDGNDMAMRAYGGFSFAPGNTDTPLVRISSAGNVGIGTTNPAAKLDILAGGNKRIATYTPTAASGISDFNVGGVGWVFSRPGDGSLAHAIYSYDSTGGTKNNLAISSRSDVVFTAGNSDPSGAPERMRITEAGNIGVGTTTPSTLLHLAGSHGTTRARLTLPAAQNGGGSGDVNLQLWLSEPGVTWDAGGIGTNVNNDNGTPNGFGRLNTGLGQSYIRFITNGGAMGFSTTTNSGTSYPNTLYLANGNVGIGTTNPTHKLAVNGTIRAKEVIVDTGWADYVFEDDYRLAPLAEVESHIKAKKHLPGIPSAAEVSANGVSMGEMQSKLLSKVEELTLHLIRMEKENAALRDRVQALETASVNP